MDREWVDKRITILSSHVRRHGASHELEPSPAIYSRLASGDDDDLRWVAEKCLMHLGMPLEFCDVTYDWSIGLDPESAGQISQTSRLYSIVIPFSMVGDGYRVGTILAHEMSHAFLFFHRVKVADQVLEAEQMTDLTAVLLGLGKMFLNGLVTPADHFGSTHRLGYLPQDLVAYAYVRTAATHRVDEETLVRHMVPDAKRLVLDTWGGRLNV